MKSDDEKLRELFETNKKPEKEKNDFSNFVKRAKFFSTLKTIIISFIMFIIIGSVLLILNTSILNRMSNNKILDLENLYDLSMPNAYIGALQSDDRIMVGDIEYVRYKFLGHKIITDGTYKEGYTFMPLINGTYGDTGEVLASQTNESKEMTAYNKVGRQVMKFYYPSVQYTTYVNDLEKLEEIDKYKLMELSLSFDKDYTIDEVKNMIPKEVTLNWYWIDVTSPNVLVNSTHPLEEYMVYGIKALNNQGDSLSNPENHFIHAITSRNNREDYSGRYKSLYNALAKGKDEITKEDIKIIGVVVSGDVESLKSLIGKTFIKASTIGAVADKY